SGAVRWPGRTDGPTRPGPGGTAPARSPRTVAVQTIPAAGPAPARRSVPAPRTTETRTAARLQTTRPARAPLRPARGAAPGRPLSPARGPQPRPFPGASARRTGLHATDALIPSDWRRPSRLALGRPPWFPRR